MSILQIIILSLVYRAGVVLKIVQLGMAEAVYSVKMGTNGLLLRSDYFHV